MQSFSAQLWLGGSEIIADFLKETTSVRLAVM